MPKIALDDFDRKILDLLQSDGRMSNQQLSDAIGLSPSPCLRRLRHLEASEVISGYVALVNAEAVGQRVNAFVRVRLERQGDREIARFEVAVSKLPEVMECYLMTGDCDYQLRVLTPTLEDFETFLRTKLTKIEGVASMTTSFALRAIRYSTKINLTAVP